MAYDGWIKYGDEELVNVLRTALLAEAHGVDSVWTTPESAEWILRSVGVLPENYPSALSALSDIEQAPWFTTRDPASAEFFGLLPLSVPALDDSMVAASTTEYVTNGGATGKARHSTRSIVVSAAIVASTDRGADFGKKWLDRTLGKATGGTRCEGVDLRFFAHEGTQYTVAPVEHFRAVRLGRGATVTRKRTSECSATWLVTFTLTADDPFTYGEPIGRLSTLGAQNPSPLGPGTLKSYGLTTTLTEIPCPVWDYTPVYNPSFPALVPSPTAPDFRPDGWGATPGKTFRRSWVRINPTPRYEPNLVPKWTLTALAPFDTVRLSVWPNDALIDARCEPLYTVTVGYIPMGVTLTIDPEQEAAYIWDGASAVVRRADTLLFGAEGRPVQWTSFSDDEGLLITMDEFNPSASAGTDGLRLRAKLEFVPKSV